MITDVNPFIYSHPVDPEDVIDRDEETEKLLAQVVGGHFVRLYAPRKYGKTSLLQRALRDGERSEGLIPIIVDLYRVVSIAYAVRVASFVPLRPSAESEELRFFQNGELPTLEIPATQRPIVDALLSGAPPPHLF